MNKRPRSHHRKPRYEAGPFKPRDDDAWMVYDARQGRLVAIPLNMDRACILAHTLNVADLAAPVTDFDGDPYPSEG